MSFSSVEICAGAGGQALGLELAGFSHSLAVELDAHACNTLRHNRSQWKIAEGDVADPAVWDPRDYEGVDLLAGGVPCPPFTIAGKQLGATDERDLFAWAIELAAIVKPKALLLENVRGLSGNRFAAYRQHVLDRLRDLDYVPQWQLLQASDYGVPQLRPRFVLVALQSKFAPHFSWPKKLTDPPTVGETLHDLMAQDGWPGADAWKTKASAIAPTIVGGSKKHGGADLGPTRAKRAWAELGVDAMGVADAPPAAGMPADFLPKLTCAMVARIQGWNDRDSEFAWEFTGRKTATYRQIGNAFPPPVARALGVAVAAALRKEGPKRQLLETTEVVHDPIYKALSSSSRFMSMRQINRVTGLDLDAPALERHIGHLAQDFEMSILQRSTGPAYQLGAFKGFTGQDTHQRNELFSKHRSTIS